MAYNIKEYRIILPMTLEQYRIAQLFTVAEVSKDVTGAGEGVEILKNEPYVKGDEKGQYTQKMYHLETNPNIPTIIKKIAPKGMLKLKEESWNDFPKYTSVMTNGWMGENLEISVESLHFQDDGKQDNVHKLPADQWKNTKVVTIDIANDEISTSHYKPEHDPAKLDYEIEGRGKLGANWINDCKKNGVPMMCCYKLIKCKCKWFMIGSAVEKVIHEQLRKIFFLFHRQLYCSMKDWHGKTLQDIRQLEDKTTKDLEDLRLTKAE